MHVYDRLRARVISSVKTKPTISKLTESIASVSFDDFPKSSWRAGGPILERYQVKATYYVAGSLCGRTDNGIEYYDETDLAGVYEAGHEIGSHTFAHRNVSEMSSNDLHTDMLDNRAFIRRTVGDVVPETFAYPYGETSLRTKNVFGHHFTCSRGTESGVNKGILDLTQLKVISIESKEWSKESIARVIKKASVQPCWIIFFTHDIADKPSRYGSTSSMLETTIDTTIAGGIRMVTVRDGLALACGGNDSVYTSIAERR